MFINFKIKKGKHNSNSWLYRYINLLCKPFVKKYKRMERTIVFNKNCLYIPQNDDTNKLFGFTLGLVHDNSIRFGWRCNPNSSLIQIMCYYYYNGKMYYKPLLYVKPEKEYNYILEYSDSRYRFIVKNNYNEYITSFETEKLKFKDKYFSYNLYFYFGGDLTAPHDMEIKMK